MHPLLRTFCFAVFSCIVTTASAQNGIITVKSTYSVEETSDRLEQVLNEKGITIFTKIDHQQGALDADMELPPTVLFIAGNPKLGTPVMQCSRLAALDLPQKFLITENVDDSVHISYNDPNYLKNRHAITGCDEIINKIATALKNIAGSAAGQN